MSKIPEAELERLKSSVSVERLAQSRGVVMRRRGDELLGLCPFHEDHSPSLVINSGKNLWHCLGACQSGGSVIDWVMKAEGVSFRHAVELLRNDVSPLVADASSKRIIKRATTSKLKSPVDTDGDSQRQLQQVVDYYHETLKQSPEALTYLEKRGLQSSEMVERFRLGFSNRTLGYHLPFRDRAGGAEIRDRLQSIGILRKTGHEHFRGSLVIPVSDEVGNVTEVYGRKITDKLRKDTPLHLYLPGPHRGVWNIQALQASEEIILCESLIDALTFWCAGYRNVTASYGIEGFTSDHHEAFKRHGIKRVLIAYDRDEPGEKAAASLADKLVQEGMECFRIEFPRGMDANEYAVKVQPASKSLGLAIRKAVWLGKGEYPEITSQSVSIETSIEAAKEEKNISSKHRARIYSPPCVEEEERSEMNTGPTCVDDDPVFPFLAAETESIEPVASPVPPGPPSPVEAEVKTSEVVLRFGDRRWRIRGLEKNLSVSLMKVNVLVASGDAFHVDTFDLYTARHRQVFIKQAAVELGVGEATVKKDLGKVLLKLEELQEEQINRELRPKEEPAVKLSAEEKKAALDLLKDPTLLDRILTDFEKCGVVGEEMNKLIGYLAAVSRKLEEPLAIVIQSSSAAGKSSLMEAILSFFPREEQVKYSAMTGQSLFYMGETDLQHKILAIAEEEGAERATYALKLLQSEGELTIASTGKDPATGRLVTQEYRVEGPVMIFLTTTAIEIDDELLNRCIVLSVDEEREQTRAIHQLQRQRQTLEGLLARQDRSQVLKVHQDAQRLLRPLLVANPFAHELTFLDDRTRTRRDHMKYLTLIRAIALLHQYQRPIERVKHQGGVVSYIDVTLDDIEIANRLANQVLGRSLDELAPQTRRLLTALDAMVTEQCNELGMDREDYRFTRREVREHTGVGNTQLKTHMHRLEELEYLIVHHGGRGQQFIYELAYEGQGRDGTPFLSKLLDVKKLAGYEYDANRSGVKAGWSGSGRGQVGPKSGGGRGGDRPLSSNDSDDKKPINGKSRKITSRDKKKNTSYLPHHNHTSPMAIQAKGAE